VTASIVIGHEPEQFVLRKHAICDTLLSQLHGLMVSWSAADCCLTSRLMYSMTQDFAAIFSAGLLVHFSEERKTIQRLGEPTGTEHRQDDEG